mmetsp:Transcript_28804/g.49051  ORF Transcript_28804/g.49051 Transcript_28804/m.49051 type:complete len:206 (-) Transcript_28804:824-1441(-)
MRQLVADQPRLDAPHQLRLLPSVFNVRHMGPALLHQTVFGHFRKLLLPKLLISLKHVRLPLLHSDSASLCVTDVQPLVLSQWDSAALLDHLLSLLRDEGRGPVDHPPVAGLPEHLLTILSGSVISSGSYQHRLRTPQNVRRLDAGFEAFPRFEEEASGALTHLAMAQADLAGVAVPSVQHNAPLVHLQNADGLRFDDVDLRRLQK